MSNIPFGGQAPVKLFVKRILCQTLRRTLCQTLFDSFKKPPPPPLPVPIREQHKFRLADDVAFGYEAPGAAVG